MPHSTLMRELFHAGSHKLGEELMQGQRPQLNMMDMHSIRGYADSLGAAGRGALWSLQIPTLLWSRGMAFGAIKTYPGNPGGSFLIDSDYILKNFKQMMKSKAKTIWMMKN